MFSIMLFIFLCFFGILAVLVYMLRCQEKLVRQLREDHAQLRVMLRAMESRLDYPGGSQPSAADVSAADVSVTTHSNSRTMQPRLFRRKPRWIWTRTRTRMHATRRGPQG